MKTRFLAPLIAIGSVFALMLVPTVANAVSVPPAYVVTSGPGSQFYGYTAPVIVIEKGGAVTYVNLDIAMHNVVQDPAADGIAGSNKQPWCRSYKKGQCPLFWTKQIAVGQQTEVLGLDKIEPGASYTFFCTLHESMRGTLVVSP